MMHAVFFFRQLGLLVFLGYFAHAQAEIPLEAFRNFPYAHISSDTIDMGMLEPGSSGSASFTITNAGQHDLLVARVRSSCGLLVTTWPTQPIKPGEQGTVNFRYDTSRPGPFKRNIVIHTNAWQKNIVVQVYGEVIKTAIKQ